MEASADASVMALAEALGEAEKSADASAATAPGAEFQYAELKLFQWLHLPDVALRAHLLTRLPYRRLAVSEHPGAN